MEQPLPAPLRVASVPATHVYVRRLAHPDVTRLQDPSGDDLRTPRFLDPDWVRDNAHDFDILHVHFGFEFYGADRLEAVCDELARAGVPLVFTCHDLRNPNHHEPDVQDAALDVWMRRADEVVTLTDWAAEEIHARFGRSATVLPHPHVVPIDDLRLRQARPRPRHADVHRTVLHFKSLRANMVGAPVLRTALEAIAEHEGARLRVHLHCDVLDPDSGNHDPELVDLALATVRDAASPMDLHVHHFLSRDELHDLIEGADAFVLPYRFGSHSGLLEACRDLGTAVVAPSCGGYARQGAHHVFRADEVDGIDLDDLRSALSGAITAGRPQPVPADYRDAQRRAVAAVHERLYRRLVRG